MRFACIGITLKVIAVFIVFSQASAAQDRTTSSHVVQDPLAGIVLNRTVTVSGQDFYRYFVAAWRDRALSERYALAIHERPNARLGSQIWIEVGQRRIFQTTLPPARSQVRAISEQAVDTAHEAVIAADVQRLMFRDQDVAPDEI